MMLLFVDIRDAQRISRNDDALCYRAVKGLDFVCGFADI